MKSFYVGYHQGHGSKYLATESLKHICGLLHFRCGRNLRNVPLQFFHFTVETEPQRCEM